MKRLYVLGASLLVFTACTQTALPKEEVFSRAMTAIREFSSASFTLHALSKENGGEKWKADAIGQMASGGKQLRFDLDASMGSDASLKGSIVIPAENEIYVKAERLSLGGSISPMLGAVEGTWWQLPRSATGSQAAAELTPDPSFLSMQMEIVTVAKEHGIERINQRKAYKYDVTMDETRLMNYLQTVEQDRGQEFNRAEWQTYLDSHDIAGTLWIDTELFLPDRIEWTVRSAPTVSPETELTIDISFADHNKDVSITPPEGAIPFPVTADALQNMLMPPTPTLP